MALSLANVELTDTFNTWRVRTNSVIGEAASISASATQVFTANVQAPYFIGDGSQLTNAGSTVATDGGANRDLSVVFTGITSGTMTTANVSSSLTFNPSTGTLSSTKLLSTNGDFTTTTATTTVSSTVRTSDLQDSSGRTLTIRDAANNIVWGG